MTCPQPLIRLAPITSGPLLRNPKVLLGFAVTVQTVSSLVGLGIIAAVSVPVFMRLETVDNETPDGLTGSDEFATMLTKDAAFPKRMGRPEEYGRLAVAIVENPMLNAGTIRLDGGQRFAPK